MSHPERDNDMNSGGRQRFVRNSSVRILELSGKVSTETYLVDPESGTDEHVRADRKGLVVLQEAVGKRTIKIHFRRILPLEVDGKAPVIESGDKFRAVCPKCGNVEDVSSNDESLQCPDCGPSPLHWIGVKPMTTKTDEATPETAETAETAETTEVDSKPKTAKAAKTTKAAKTAKEPVLVDFDELKGTDGCELYSKNAKFDHAGIDAKAHVLLLVDGDAPRKLCFNTYDGALGKKATGLPVKEFLADKPVAGAKREKPWFAVKDVEKARAKLARDGYEKV